MVGGYRHGRRAPAGVDADPGAGEPLLWVVRGAPGAVVGAVSWGTEVAGGTWLATGRAGFGRPVGVGFGRVGAGLAPPPLVGVGAVAGVVVVGAEVVGGEVGGAEVTGGEVGGAEVTGATPIVMGLVGGGVVVVCGGGWVVEVVGKTG